VEVVTMRRIQVQTLRRGRGRTRPSVRTVPRIVGGVARFLGKLIKRVGRVAGSVVGRRR
jgi:hypothetical protein